MAADEKNDKSFDDAVREWFTNLPPVPPEEAEQIDKIIEEAFEEVFGRPMKPHQKEVQE